MESPRGLNDPALGALAEVVARADVIVLLGKEPDFTLRFGQARRRSMRRAASWSSIPMPSRSSARSMSAGRERVALSANADSVAAAHGFSSTAGARM